MKKGNGNQEKRKGIGNKQKEKGKSGFRPKTKERGRGGGGEGGGGGGTRERQLENGLSLKTMLAVLNVSRLEKEVERVSCLEYAFVARIGGNTCNETLSVLN